MADEGIRILRGRGGEGVNLAGEGVILGTTYLDPDEAEEFIERCATLYAKTPVFAAADVPRGQYIHVGEGVWLKRCRGCDDYVMTYGTILFTPVIGEHERTHELDVVGINIPLLG